MSLNAADSIDVSDDQPEGFDLKPLLKRSDIAGLVRLIIHLGILCVTAWLVFTARQTSFFVSSLILHGVVLVFLFCPLHETIHRTAFRSRVVNDSLAWLLGLVLLLPSINFRCFHLTHHRFTQIPGEDPELDINIKTGRFGFIKYITGVSHWMAVVRDLSAMAFPTHVPEYVLANKVPAIRRQARTYLVIYACLCGVSIVTQSSWLLWVWFIPSILGQPFMRAYLLAEHSGCEFSADMLSNSRTMVPAGFLVKLLAWNMPYHAEHHRYPAVPFHQLPKLHAFIGDRVKFRYGHGYARFCWDWWRSLS